MSNNLGTLRNGAEVIARAVATDEGISEVVLASYEGKLAIWNLGEDGLARAGAYFEPAELKEAIQYFAERVGIIYDYAGAPM